MTTQFVTGISKGENASTVALDAFEQAKRKLMNQPIHLAIVYCSSQYNYQEVVSTIRKATGNALLIGASTGGEFTEERVEQGSISVGLLSSDTIKFYLAMAKGLKENEAATIQKLVDSLPKKVENHPELTGLLFIDGLAGKGEEAVVNASLLFDFNIKLFGGSAGDDLKFKETYVFCNDEVFNNGAAICLMASQKPFNGGVQHGHIPLSPPLTITKAEANVVYEVNNRPAWDVWKENCAEHAKSIGIDTNQLTESSDVGAFLIRYELGFDMKDGNYKIRVPLSKNDDGSLNFACTVPNGSTFNIMLSDEAKQISSAKTALEIAHNKAKGQKIAGALIFDCVCRNIICGKNFYKTVEEYKKVLPNIPILGWETYGEICISPGDFSGFHNTTSVVLLIPE